MIRSPMAIRLSSPALPEMEKVSDWREAWAEFHKTGDRRYLELAMIMKCGLPVDEE